MPKVYGFDTETFLILPGLLAPRLVCGSWASENEEWIGSPEETIAFFTQALKRGDHLAGVNLAYDIVVLAAYQPELIPLIFEAGDAGQFHCCSVREALNDIAKGGIAAKGDELVRYSQALLMLRHFNEDISAEKEGDVWRYKYGQLAHVPIPQWPAAAIDYPKKDARRPLRIFNAQNGFKNLHDEAAQVRAAITIQFMCVWGLRTDGAYLQTLSAEADRMWNELRTELGKIGIFRPDGSKDMVRLRELVTKAYNGTPPMTKGGEKAKPQVATDRDTLIESGDPILEKLGTSGKNDKRKTTYIPALLRGVSVPLNPQFNILVDTGRVSSDFQQLPQKGGLREGVIARPNTVIASLDYEGLELRTMAERAIRDPDVRFSKMADYLNAGKDAHSYVGGFFLGLSYEEFLARKAELKIYRDVAKMFNFGAGGGAGPGAIAYNAKVKDNIRLCLSLNRAERCGVRRDPRGNWVQHKKEVWVDDKKKLVCCLCIEIAAELKEKWLRAWPEQGILFQKASWLTQKGRKTDVTVFSSGRVRGECHYTQWLNTPFQGAGGDGMKRAMWQIDKESKTNRRSALWGSHIILNVHDELWIEFPDDQRRHDGAFRAAQIMIDTMNEVTTHVKNNVEPAIMRRVFKAAAAVYDSNRNLRPWWPPDSKPKPTVWAWEPDQEVMARDLAA